jgi:hypothetical protein
MKARGAETDLAALHLMDTDQYCRDIEAHLCRRNGGHLVRIAGPAFELVRGWAQRGIPLTVALQGIDRYVDRSSAKGMRRRPARVEFCEADVLDAFDAWRRAVGIYRADAEGDRGGEGAGSGDGGPAADAPRGRARESLSTHLDRVIVRLTSMRTGEVPEAWDATLEEFVRTLDAMHPAARRARGEARERILADLEALDARLMERARASAGADLLAEAAREAAAELEPFAARLSPAAHAAALHRCENRVLRARLRLPTITLD